MEKVRKFEISKESAAADGIFTAYRKQLHRMATIVSLLKQNDLVPMKKILRALEATEFADGAYLGCCNRTIQRDIKALQVEYHAPIEYSKAEAAYTLLSKEWTFRVPALLNSDELLALVIGGKLARDILPSGIGTRVSRAVDEIVRYNETEFSMPGLVNSVQVVPDAVATVSDGIFNAVFGAWQSRHLLRIHYEDYEEESSLCDIEPQTLVFQDMHWHILGYNRMTGEVRTYRVSHIHSAQILEVPFTPRPGIAELPGPAISADHFDNITVRLNAAGKRFAKEVPLHAAQTFATEDDGHSLMFVPTASRKNFVAWMLRQQGNAQPVEPVAAVEAVRSVVRRLAVACQLL